MSRRMHGGHRGARVSVEPRNVLRCRAGGERRESPSGSRGRTRFDGRRTAVLSVTMDSESVSGDEAPSPFRNVRCADRGTEVGGAPLHRKSGHPMRVASQKKCCGDSSDVSVNTDSSESPQHGSDRNIRSEAAHRRSPSLSMTTVSRIRLLCQPPAATNVFINATDRWAGSDRPRSVPGGGRSIREPHRNMRGPVIGSSCRAGAGKPHAKGARAGHGPVTDFPKVADSHPPQCKQIACHTNIKPE